MNTKKDIGKVLKNKLDELNEAPDFVVWNNIASQLDRDNQKVLYKRLLLLLLLLLGFSYLLLKHFNILKSNSTSENLTQVTNTTYNNIDTDENCKDENTDNTTNNSNYIVKNTSINYSNKKRKHIPPKKEVLTLTSYKRGKGFALTLKPKGITPLSFNYKKNNELIINKNNKQKEKNIRKKWSISLVNGVNLLNTNIKKSTINNNPFNNITTTKENSISYSFGINMSYQLTDKVSFRSGIHKLTMNFNTVNIPNTINQIGNILTSKEYVPSLSNQNFISLFNNDETFNITEEINYLEFPIELEYNFLKKAPNLKLVTGLSYLLLDNNTIYAYSKNTKKFKIGASNDIRGSASLNIGINQSFRLTKKLSINLEMKYKQYFNIYRSNEPNLDTRILNVQTGLHYKF